MSRWRSSSRSWRCWRTSMDNRQETNAHNHRSLPRKGGESEMWRIVLPKFNRDHSRKRRPGFTLVELCVAAAIVAVLFVIVAQCVAVSFRERARAASRHAATELAANVLEAARAQPFDKLDKTW